MHSNFASAENSANSLNAIQAQYSKLMSTGAEQAPLPDHLLEKTVAALCDIYQRLQATDARLTIIADRVFGVQPPQVQSGGSAALPSYSCQSDEMGAQAVAIDAAFRRVFETVSRLERI